MTYEFYSNQLQKDGYSNQCEECKNTYIDMYEPK
jgi:hypothetical protein